MPTAKYIVKNNPEWFILRYVCMPLLHLNIEVCLITILKLKYFANDMCPVAGANNKLIPHLYIRFIVTAFASTNVTC